MLSAQSSSNNIDCSRCKQTSKTGGGSGNKGGDTGSSVDTNYTYYKYINTPSDLGMEPGYDLSNISDGVAGITSYIQLLVEGRSNASKTGKPLGNKYFYKTSQTCKDPMGNIQPLALYVDNVPSGNLGIIPKGTGGNVTSYKGLLPGIIENAFSLAQIDFFSAFSSMEPPKCQNVTLQTIDTNNNISTDSGYISIDDIANISPCNFVNNGYTNVVTGGTCGETFVVHDETRMSKRNEKKYKKINKKINKKLKKLYKNDDDDNGNSSDSSSSDSRSSDSSSSDSDGDSSKKNKNKNKGYKIVMPDDAFLKIFIFSFGALWVYIALKLMANMYKKR